MKKLFFIILISGLIFYSLISVCLFIKTDYFRVIFFDVGQGDSALIITPGGKTILIDGGPDQKVLRGLGEALPFWQRKIDLLVITHAHDDHITGLIEVSSRYKIGQILYNNLNFKTPNLEALIKVLRNKKIKMLPVNAGMSFNFNNNCSLNILAANKELDLDENDYSIIAKFNCLNKKILLAGDAGVFIENKLLASGVNLNSDIFKISHHGSTTANSENFLKAINPLAVVVSVGLNNKFKHPATIILDRLQKMLVDIYRTDKQGTISFLANNNEIKLIK